MAGEGNSTHGRLFAHNKGMSRDRHIIQLTSRKTIEEDYYTIKILVKSQQHTIRGLQQKLSNNASVLQDNSQLQEALEASTRRCSDLQTSLSASNADLVNTQETLKLLQDQLHVAHEELEQLEQFTGQQEAEFAAVQADNVKLTAQLHEAERKVAFSKRVMATEQQALAATKEQLTSCQAQLAAAVKARNHLSSVLAKARANPLGSIAAALAVAPTLDSPAVDVIMWLAMLFLYSCVVPVTMLIALTFVAAAAAMLRIFAYSSILLVWMLRAAADVWAVCSSDAASYCLLVKSKSMSIALQLRVLLCSRISGLSCATCSLLDGLVTAHAHVLGRCRGAADAFAVLYNRLVGAHSIDCASTAASGPVSRPSSFGDIIDESAVGSDNDSSSGSSSSSTLTGQDSMDDIYSDDVDAAYDVVVQVCLGTACTQVGSVVGGLCSDAKQADVDIDAR